MPEVEDFGTQETARSDWTVCVWFRGLQGCGRKTYAYLLIFIFILGLSTTHQKAWGGTPRGSSKQLLQMSRANMRFFTKTLHKPIEAKFGQSGEIC